MELNIHKVNKISMDEILEHTTDGGVKFYSCRLEIATKRGERLGVTMFIDEDKKEDFMDSVNKFDRGA